MFTKPGLSALCLLIILAGCGSKAGVNQSSTTTAEQTASASPAPSVQANATADPLSSVPSNNPAAAHELNACALIETSEIVALQGAGVQSTVPTSQKKDKLSISQCYFGVTSADGTKNLSVHLQVLKPDPKDPDAAKEYWERTFDEKERKENGREREEEKEGGKPESVRGIGEEAFWIANAKFGVLYALQKGTIARISVGGPDDAKTRLEKSKTLMTKVLKRMT